VGHFLTRLRRFTDAFVRMDGGLRKAEDVPADTAVCDEAINKAGSAAAGSGGAQKFRSARDSGQRVLDASDAAAAAVTVVDELHEHNVAALSDKALSLGRTARAILQAHAAAVGSADTRALLDAADEAAAASHGEVGAVTGAGASVAVAAASSASDATGATLSSAAEVRSDYTKSHIVPTSEQDLLHYLCGRTIAQTHAEKALPPVAGHGGFATCIARRAKDSDPELQGDKVLADYYAAAGGDRAAILAALDQVCPYADEKATCRSGRYVDLWRESIPSPKPFFLSNTRTPTHTPTTTTANLACLSCCHSFFRSSHADERQRRRYQQRVCTAWAGVRGPSQD